MITKYLTDSIGNLHSAKVSNVALFIKASFTLLPTSSKYFFKKCTNKIDDYEVTYGFYSNGNNECNRNELGRQSILST